MSADLRKHEGGPVIIWGGIAGLLIPLHLAPKPVLVLRGHRWEPKRPAPGRKAASPLPWAMKMTTADSSLLMTGSFRLISAAREVDLRFVL